MYTPNRGNKTQAACKRKHQNHISTRSSRLESSLGGEEFLDFIHLVLRDNVDGMDGTDAVLLIKDLLALHVRCNSPGVALEACLVGSGRRHVPLVLRGAQPRQDVARVVGIRVSGIRVSRRFARLG